MKPGNSLSACSRLTLIACFGTLSCLSSGPTSAQFYVGSARTGRISDPKTLAATYDGKITMRYRQDSWARIVPRIRED
jgi:hypothetical protein